MKNKNKVERYIERYCKKIITSTVYSQRSTYYHLGHRVIRVSDHVAFKSDGDLSIILDSHDTEHYIIHAVKSGEVSVVTYNELKQVIRSIHLLPAIVYIANTGDTLESTSSEIIKNTPEKAMLLKTGCSKKFLPVYKKDATVLGVDIKHFEPGGLQTIASITYKVRSRMGWDVTKP